MIDLPSPRWLLSVAQQSFIADDNQFGTLKPLVSDDGTLAQPSMFPNNGYVWWMLLYNAHSLAQPGRLLIADLEEARQYVPTDPTRQRYQVVVDSIRPPTGAEAREILTLTGQVIGHPRDLINRPDLLVLDHPPTSTVYVRSRDRIYGPLKATTNPRPDGQYAVSLTASQTNAAVLSLSQVDLSALGTGYIQRLTETVALDNQTPSRSLRIATVTYELICGEALEQIDRGAYASVVLHTDEQLLSRLAKRLQFKRKERQSFVETLHRMQEGLIPDEVMEGQVLEALERTLSSEGSQLEQLAEALLTSGKLEEALNTRLAEREARHIDESTARLEAEIEARLAGARKDLELVRREIESQKEEFDVRRRRDSLQLERELLAIRETQERELQEERHQLEGLREQLEDQRAVVRRTLEQVAERLHAGRDGVITDFLALLPLLERVLPTHVALPPEPNSSLALQEPRPEAKRFEAPAFILGLDEESTVAALSETLFFDRFVSHVHASGFRYRRDDLLAFHLSVKCNDITLLSGVSGTGKSSLPVLYAEALAGERRAELDEKAGGRYLHVAVRPSWLDMQDLLGHVNLLDREFVPSESGLYRQMMIALEEYRRRGAGSGVYLTCLDEMNLSHVEHYFSGFLQALERRDGERFVRCFDRSSVSELSMFRDWHTLEVPRSVRFVGTVNNDETTRPLSIRFLDRTNVIDLRTSDFGGLSTIGVEAAGKEIPVTGPPVRLRELRNWVHDQALPATLAVLLDQMRGPLQRLGRPISPRRYRGLCRYVASAQALCSQDQAFDQQVVQRILPQVRGHFGSRAREDTTDLLRALETEAGRFPESMAALQLLAGDPDSGRELA